MSTADKSPLTLYRTGKWTDSIEVVECEKVTEKTVFIKGRTGVHRQAKDSEYNLYHDSEEQAVEYLKDRLRRQIDSLKKQLSMAESSLEKLGGSMIADKAIRTIAIPETPVSRRRHPKTDMYCVVCRKDIRNVQNPLSVHVIDGGSRILHPEDELQYVPDSGDCGTYSIGSDCAHKLGMEWVCK